MALGPSAPCESGLPHSNNVRGLSGQVCSGASRVQLVLCCLWLRDHPSRGERAATRGAAATPRWRRRGVQGTQRPCTRLCRFVPTRSARHVPPYQQILSATAEARCDGVECRPKTPLDGVGERSPAPATAGCRLVVSVTEAEAKWHCCGARETAQALQHGCGEDCWRSASPAAPHARPLALH